MFETVDSVVGDLQKKVAQLRKLQEKHDDKASYLSGVVAELVEEMEIHANEAKRAVAVSKKIENLISAE
jgi:hypothetical protein